MAAFRRIQKGLAAHFFWGGIRPASMKVNEGEVPQYYVANSHPDIIEPEIFDLVQYELNRRKKDGRWTSSTYPFSGKVICGGMVFTFRDGNTVEIKKSEWRAA